MTTPLCLAAVTGKIPVIDFLFELGAVVTQRVLEYSCRSGNVHIFRILYEHPTRDTSKSEWIEECLGSITRNNEILSLLIEHESDYELERILTYASWNGKLESVKMLIRAGVYANRKKFRYMLSPLECAAFRGHTEIAKILTEAGGKRVEIKW